LAGAGFKVFSNNQVLLASEVMGFMMEQMIMVFDDAAARDAAITAPSEGMFAFTKSDDQLRFYNGTSWGIF
jgi:hypothetical protein